MIKTKQKSRLQSIVRQMRRQQIWRQFIARQQVCPDQAWWLLGKFLQQK